MNPYAIISILVVWAGSLATVGAWQRHDGRLAERNAWQARENEALRTANTRILELQLAARRAESIHAQALAVISTNYERKLSDAKTQRDRDVAAARSGALRLRDPGAAGLRACGGDPAQTGPAAGERDGGAPGELSAEATEFLYTIANDADAVAEQLAACQRVVIEDRLLAGAENTDRE